MEQLTHIDEHGQSRMVDVSEKAVTRREAVARGRVRMQPRTFEMIANHAITKGNVLEVARIAGIMGAKQTGTLIPLCHPLNIASVEILFHLHPHAAEIEIEATVKIAANTGVEMEALTAASIAALTIYDMCKAVDRGMVISDIRLIKKTGGKSGAFLSEEISNSSLSA